MTLIVSIDRQIQWRPGMSRGGTSHGLKAVRVWWLFVAIGVYNQSDYRLLTESHGWVR